MNAFMRPARVTLGEQADVDVALVLADLELAPDLLALDRHHAAARLGGDQLRL
jgi:hypothetical protein